MKANANREQTVMYIKVKAVERNVLFDKNTEKWAYVMLTSGIVLAFLCFFLHGYDITDGVLWYVAKTIVYAGSIFGVSIYIKSKFDEIQRK